jgi:RNA polymerase sigma factor for flagellar operon FliA
MSVEVKTSQQLINDSQALVKSIASKIYRRLPPNVNFEDILSYGQVGLVQAARSFRSDQGTSFQTFAYYRIRGAIYDGLAKMTWTNRQAKKRVQADRMVGELLEQQVDGPDKPQLESEAQWLVETTERLTIVHLAASYGSDEHDILQSVPDNGAAPDDEIAQRETVQVLRDLLSRLPSPESELIQMTYFEGVSLTDAAERLGKSKSWASRLHAKILARLGRELAEVGVEE